MAVQFLTGLNIIGNVNLNESQLQNFIVQPLGTDPTGIAGRVYYNSGINALKLYNGTAWVALDSDTTYDLTGVGSTNGTAGVRLTETGTANTDDVLIVGAGTVGVTRSGNTLTVTGTDSANGTVTSVAATHAGDAFTASIGNVATVNPSVDITMNGASTDYINGLGNLAAFPNIPSYSLNTSRPSAGTGVSLKTNDAAVFWDVALTGISSEVEVIRKNAVELEFGLPNNVIISNNLTVTNNLDVTGTGSFTGQVSIPLVPSAAASATSKQYVDQSNIGQSVFQGGYDAATNTPDLDTAPSSLIKKGWFWAVTNVGDFFTEEVQPGDLLYANIDDPGATYANWTVVQSGQDIAGEGVNDGATTKGIAGFNSAHFNVTANGYVSSDIYGGTSALGIVPSGGTSTTFLKGDGTWATPVDTGALGAKVALTSGVTLLGVTTFTYDVTTSFSGAVAEDVKCEIISNAGETVYAGVTRSGVNLIIKFNGTIADNTYKVLLTYIG